MKFSARQNIQAFFRKKLIRFLSPGVKFGKNIYIGRNCTITSFKGLDLEGDIYIGKNVTIEVDGIIGSKTLIANNVGIIGKNDHDSSNLEIPIFDAITVREDLSLSLHTKIGRGVWVGYGAIILSGISIGDNAIIAAGSVVTKDVPSAVVVAGNPAKIVKERN